MLCVCVCCTAKAPNHSSKAGAWTGPTMFWTSRLPPGLHFGAAAAAFKDMVESATAALLLFFSPFQNSMAIITVGPARPTPEEGFCECVCCYKDSGLEFETFFGEVWLTNQSFYNSLRFRCS